MTAIAEAKHEISALHAVALGLIEALERQQQLLRMRNLQFQPGLMEILSSLPAGFERVQAAMDEDEKELMQLRALAETTALINSSLDLDTVLVSAMDSVLRLTGAGRGYILLLDEQGELQTRVARRREAGDDDSGVSRAILRQVITNDEPLLTDNASHDPRVQQNATVGRYTLRSILCVPLRFRSAVGGAVYVDNRFREGVFTNRELYILTAFANQIAVAVENARLFTSVQQSLDELAHATALMQNVFASIASGVITTDSRDAITAFNASAAQILNTPPELAVAQPLRAVMPPLGGAFEEALLAAETENISASLETETEIAGRGRTALRLKVSPLRTYDRGTEGVAIVLDDLTAEREREQALDVLRRYLPPGMIEHIHEISQLSMGGARREVTCMFVNVGAIAQFGMQRPQQTMEMLNIYLEAITRIIHSSGGVIDKYNGSEVMALFNTQLNPQPDHARRALDTARVLREAFQALYFQQGGLQGMDYRIGIHSGVATLGNIGGIQRKSFTALGDCINLAKRLQENAAAGQILLSELTYAQLDSTWPDLVECPPLQVKGRQQMTRVYEVLHRE